MISHGLQLALDACNGSYNKLAKAAGVSWNQVAEWVSSKPGHIPAEHVLTLERNLRISRHLLRPDIYPGGGEHWLRLAEGSKFLPNALHHSSSDHAHRGRSASSLLSLHGETQC